MLEDEALQGDGQMGAAILMKESSESVCLLSLMLLLKEGNQITILVSSHLKAFVGQIHQWH